jgi:hypothetical protein
MPLPSSSAPEPPHTVFSLLAVRVRLADESNKVAVFIDGKTSHGANIQYLTKAHTSGPAKQSELASATNTWLPEIFISRSATRWLVTSRSTLKRSPVSRLGSKERFAKTSSALAMTHTEVLETKSTGDGFVGCDTHEVENASSCRSWFGKTANVVSKARSDLPFFTPLIRCLSIWMKVTRGWIK